MIFIQYPNTGHVVTRDHNVNTNLEKESTNINVYFSPCHFFPVLIKHNRTSLFKSIQYLVFHILALKNFFISARPYSNSTVLLLSNYHVDRQSVQIIFIVS